MTPLQNCDFSFLVYEAFRRDASTIAEVVRQEEKMKGRGAAITRYAQRPSKTCLHPDERCDGMETTQEAPKQLVKFGDCIVGNVSRSQVQPLSRYLAQHDVHTERHRANTSAQCRDQTDDQYDMRMGARTIQYTTDDTRQVGIHG